MHLFRHSLLLLGVLLLAPIRDIAQTSQQAFIHRTPTWNAKSKYSNHCRHRRKYH
jgi:hypothetical protein